MNLVGRFPYIAATLAAILGGAGALAFAPAPPEPPPEKLVFTSASADGKKIGIFVMNPDGSQRTTLTKEGAIEIDPALSPDGKRIAFVVVDKADIKGDLWIMGADGTGRKQLTESKAKTVVMAPAWSPDGRRLAFTRMTSEAFRGPPTDAELVTADPDGRNEKTIGKGLFPAWSPDGKQMLYTTIDKGARSEPRLNVMDADGKNSKQLFDTPSMLGAFSPDGKRITYMGAASTSPDNPPAIYVSNPDGSNAAQASKAAGGFELAPHWSADGKRIYFSRMAKSPNGLPDKAAIIAMDADGGNEKELTRGDGMDMLGAAGLWLVERVAAAPPPKP